jgi:hypothetical protein
MSALNLVTIIYFPVIPSYIIDFDGHFVIGATYISMRRVSQFSKGGQSGNFRTNLVEILRINRLLDFVHRPVLKNSKN